MSKFRGKNVRHFRLVNRSVLQADEPDRVFVEVDAKGVAISDHEEELVDVDSVPQAGEAAKYGIFFDDRNYDYTRHLKPIGQSPDAVFVPASQVSQQDNVEAEEEYYYGEMDNNEELEEVLEALEDEEYCDEDFDDNLVVKLNRDDDARVLQSYKQIYESSGEEDLEEEEDEEVISGVQQLDEIRKQLKEADDGKFMSRIQRYEVEQESDQENQYVEVVEEDCFDCQSILSTLNTGINLPNIIREDVRPIRLSNRTGLPSRLSTVTSEDESDEQPAVNKGAARNRDETAEEKRARKAAAKAEAKEKRESKKNRQK